MKRIVFWILGIVVALLLVAIIGVAFFLDAAIKRGVETAGPALAKVPVKLDAVSLSLFSGAGKLKGLEVGNPEGFKTPSALKIGSASLAVQPGSLFGDKVVIRSINLQAPEITFETDLKGNNLSKILSNVQASTGGDNATPKPSEPKQTTQAKATKKLQVDEFLITNGKINVSVTALGGKSATVPLPEIHLTGLGQGPDGITPAELAKRVLQALEKEAVKASSTAVADLGKQATELGRNVTGSLSKGTTGAVENVTKSIGGFLKK